MLYTELLKNEKIQTALKSADVHNVASPLLKDGDFSFEVGKVDDELINLVTDKEILIRRQHVALENKMEPIRKKEARVIAVRPHVEKLLHGKFAGPYSTLEKGVIDHISEAIAEKHDFTTIIQPAEDLSGFSELDRILKTSSITYLESQVKNPEDVVLNFVANSGFVKMMK